MNPEMKQWLDDHFDVDILDGEKIQDVLDLLMRKPDEAAALLTAYRLAAWKEEVALLEAESDEFNDFILNQYGIDRFGSMEAARKAWQERA